MRSIKTLFTTILGCLLVLCVACSQENTSSQGKPSNTDNENALAFRYLALGDSYTYGQGVCSNCGFPRQLLDSINEEPDYNGSLYSIAQTGWTTTDLLQAIERSDPSADADIVTLLIGVNNQYQGRPFSVYEEEFPRLLDKAITLARGEASNVIVISIPDYVYTPFGQTLSNKEAVSQEIDQYNQFALQTAAARGVTYLNITDITRRGVEEPDLVSGDGLHPSRKAYRLFVERIYLNALGILVD